MGTDFENWNIQRFFFFKYFESWGSVSRYFLENIIEARNLGEKSFSDEKLHVLK